MRRINWPSKMPMNHPYLYGECQRFIEEAGWKRIAFLRDWTPYVYYYKGDDPKRPEQFFTVPADPITGEDSAALAGRAFEIEFEGKPRK